MDRIDLLLDDPGFRWFEISLISLAARELDDDGLDRMADAPVGDVIVDLLGPGTGPAACETERLIHAYAEALRRLAPEFSRLTPQDMDLALNAGFDDFATPAPILRAVLGGRRANASFIAVLSAPLMTSQVAPWVRLALVEGLRDGLRDYMRLIASTPGAGVPEDVVPLEERLDLEALEREYQRNRARLDASIAETARTGLPSRPFDSPST